MESKFAYLKTPIGIAKIIGTEKGIQSITVNNVDANAELIEKNEKIPHDLEKCLLQLDDYFEGGRTVFDIKLDPQGTPFQKSVWKALCSVPFGKTKTYLEQSKQLGNPEALRAVAAANGKNPIWIVIPCHRIIGSSGLLTGYAGGMSRKKWLLNHENPNKQESLF